MPCRIRILFMVLSALLLCARGASATDPCEWGFDSSSPAIPTGRSDAVGVTVGGRFYLIGGVQGDTVLSVVEAYDPVLENWETLERSPAPVARPSTNGFI